MICVIGSIALQQHFAIARPTADLDLVGSYREVVAFVKTNGTIRSIYPINNGKTLVVKYADGRITEACLTWPDSLAAELHTLICEDPMSVRDTAGGFELTYASLNMLYMLKMSHRYLRNSPAFKKTMDDIHRMRWASAFIPEDLEAHYKRRQKEQYAYAHPKLDVTKTDFFNGDGVNYVYDHDSIHEAVKHLDKPAYAYFKPEDSPVMVSKPMWDKLPYAIKILSVLEEAYVLSIERSQIPFPMTAPIDSFKKALEKVCTSITSGWWREFAWEQYNTVMDGYDDKYTDRFWNAVENGHVKKYDVVNQMAMA